MTERLYVRDSLLLSFEARLVRAALHDGKPSIVLDRSAFYPEGGGQLGDRGTLTLDGLALEVIDVQIDDASGEVHHLLAPTVNEVDEIVAKSIIEKSTIAGRVERAHRRDMMSQHTGQHMLSCALLEVAGAATVSSRLGRETSTIDVDQPMLTEEKLRACEDAVNEVVLDDRPVHTLFPTEEELARLPLRRKPKVEKDIRVIHVEGFDVSPCGGTHCLATGQVGAVRIVKSERYKGMTRVTFVAGARTIADHRAHAAALGELAKELKCGTFDVASALARVRADARAASQQAGLARAELMRHLSTQLLATHAVDPSGTTRVVMARESGDLDSLRALAGALAARADVVALVAARDEATRDWLVVIERGASASFDAGRWWKQCAVAHGGRGGGRAEHAEGRLPQSVDFEAIARERGGAG